MAQSARKLPSIPLPAFHNAEFTATAFSTMESPHRPPYYTKNLLAGFTF